MQDNTHAVRQLLDDLSGDQLAALDMLLMDMLNTGKKSATYWRGQIAAMVWVKFDICPCGEEHDPDQVFAEHQPEQPNRETELKGRPIENVDLPDDDGPLYQQIITLADNEQVIVGSERWDDLIAVYNLKVVGTQFDGAMIFECRDCGKQYPSLQDRMLVATCGGCAQKEKWG
jgi:hypothetical protein